MNRPLSGKISNRDFAYHELKRQVLENDLPAGTNYLEQEVAAMLNMSRTPVREALQKLAAEGLVEIVPRRGFRVLPLSTSDMADIYCILTGLEAAAAELVALRGLDATQLDLLKQPLDEMDQALKDNDLRAWADADGRFHRALVDLSENQRLISMVQVLWDQSHRTRMTTLKLRPWPVQSNADHRALVQAIANQDAALAWQIHHQHRRNSGEILLKVLHQLNLHQL